MLLHRCWSRQFLRVRCCEFRLVNITVTFKQRSLQQQSYYLSQHFQVTNDEDLVTISAFVARTYCLSVRFNFIGHVPSLRIPHMYNRNLCLCIFSSIWFHIIHMLHTVAQKLVYITSIHPDLCTRPSTPHH